MSGPFPKDRVSGRPQASPHDPRPHNATPPKAQPEDHAVSVQQHQREIQDRQKSYASALLRAAVDIERTHHEAHERQMEVERLRAECNGRRAQMIREIGRKKREHAEALERLREENDVVQNRQQAQLDGLRRELAEALYVPRCE